MTEEKNKKEKKFKITKKFISELKNEELNKYIELFANEKSEREKKESVINDIINQSNLSRDELLIHLQKK